MEQLAEAPLNVAPHRRRWRMRSRSARCFRSRRRRRGERRARRNMSCATRPSSAFRHVALHCACRCIRARVHSLLALAPRIRQTYPTKTIKLVVPFGPGGPTDLAARIVAQVVQAGLGQNVVIENRPGAGGATGTKSVAAADPDGYTHADRHQRDARRGAGAGERIPATIRSKASRRSPRFPTAPPSSSCRRTSRRTRLRSSSPMPRPIPASSATRRPATATRRSSPPNCCSPAPASRPCMCPTRAAPRWSPRC